MSLINKKLMDLPEIPEDQRTPLSDHLLEIIFAHKEHIQLQNEIIQGLKDEIARLKGEKPKPKIKPSNLGKKPKPDEDNGQGNIKAKRPGSKKKRKKLEIHKTVIVAPENIPKGSQFKGHEDYFVQDLLIQPYNVRYRLERWVTPSGQSIIGQIPEGVRQGHFGNILIGYILYQYYHCMVTQPLLLEGLLEMGIDISSGQINNILIEGKESFHLEKEDILSAGLEVSDYVNVDDTGARHKGRNGYCTHIGNELFAWFASTESKSRINFLTLLRGKQADYVINQDALDYMQAHKLPKKILQSLDELEEKNLPDQQAWESMLSRLGITTKRHVQIVTEGALLGSILEHGLNEDIVILSDDAGQFNVFLHALCWIHAERTINKLVGFNEQQRDALNSIKDQLWTLYDDLKAYKENPSPKQKEDLTQRFDQLFTTKTCFASLNQALERIYKNKSELLLVLRRPEIPLHNNLSENDIREYVKRRKISGGTRSDLGRKARDTFVSLKKTCRKHGISFWEYLQDRLSGKMKIPRLGDWIRRKAKVPG
ncbi:transposase [Desulfonatronospira sp.]|uniref:IS66 family transposase n=1 Tax=Desulfonatronospira sp. TaxID=1962951 RepID=UPI0025BD9807|nr:transposase [Desulfonatronospira sp.]